MIQTFGMHLMAIGRVLVATVRERRRADPDADAGMSTLETVILVLGGMAMAALFVGALTQAVTSRTAQIK